MVTFTFRGLSAIALNEETAKKSKKRDINIRFCMVFIINSLQFTKNIDFKIQVIIPPKFRIFVGLLNLEI